MSVLQAHQPRRHGGLWWAKTMPVARISQQGKTKITRGAYFKFKIGCMDQTGGKYEIGGTYFKWGRAPLASPLATALDETPN